MTRDDEQKLGVLARLVLAALILLIIGGIAWYGITVQIIVRIWHQLVERPSGPMAFRFILQPSWPPSWQSCMAAGTRAPAAHRISGP
jgi:hypothetical protein